LRISEFVNDLKEQHEGINTEKIKKSKKIGCGSSVVHFLALL